MGLLASMAVLGCTRQEGKAGPVMPVPQVVDVGPVPPATAPGQPAVSEAEIPWKTERLQVKRPGMKPVTLRQVRTGSHAGYDRVVFEFEGEQFPGYEVGRVEGTVYCGSGDPAQVAGAQQVQIRLVPAQAHTAEGQPTVQERRRAPGLPALQELEQTCDFEAEVTWVLGLRGAQAWRVQELRQPARLVVDVRH